MRTLVIIATFLLGLGGSNSSLETAFQHYEAEEYQESVRYFREALREYPDQSPQIYYNMGQCMTKLDSADLALEYYHLSIRPNEQTLASLAFNNIGILYVLQSQFEEALAAFRNAMIQDPDNEKARYNYELLKRKLNVDREKENEDKPDPQAEPEDDDPDESNPPGPSNSSPPPPLPVGEYQELIDKLKRRTRNSSNSDDQPLAQSLDTISLNQAKKLLEDMRQSDVQFLQQLRKSPVSPSKKDGKPDW